MITWFELSKLNVGASLVLAQDTVVNARCVLHTIPSGTVVTIEEQGLNEIWSGIVVRVCDTELADKLHYFQSEMDGTIMLSGPDPHDEAAWQRPSPFNVDCVVGP